MWPGVGALAAFAYDVICVCVSMGTKIVLVHCSYVVVPVADFAFHEPAGAVVASCAFPAQVCLF